MKNKIEITYWWKCKAIPGEIPEELQDTLVCEAMETITDKMIKGYNSGELNGYFTINIEGLETPEDGWYCNGWFDIKNTGE